MNDEAQSSQRGKRTFLGVGERLIAGILRERRVAVLIFLPSASAPIFLSLLPPADSTPAPPPSPRLPHCAFPRISASFLSVWHLGAPFSCIQAGLCPATCS
jgi:hypothetical protein